MRRADRLFQIVQHLRGRRLTTAAQLAGWLLVSERTIYRDMQDLSLSGVPIEGEAGVGYRLGKGFDLPPIMFTLDEVEALVTGARMVEAWGGPSMAHHARSAIAKITSALPHSRREEVERTRLFAPSFHVRAEVAAGLETIRQAILGQQKIEMQYLDSAQRPSRRVVHPLGVYFWGSSWTLAAWCESRQDFRNFRLDRMQALEMLKEQFQNAPGRQLEDFLRKMQDSQQE
ncbi:MAG TPA: YafY family protein [Terriglobales bacterium]|nr:YafY family protein [Terriglobales bacterium]